MPILIDHQPVNLNGTQEIGPATVPAGVRFFTLSLARCTDATPNFWPNVATTLNAELRISSDNWVSSFGVVKFGNAVGGIAVIPPIMGGGQDPSSSMQGWIPSPLQGANWRIKAFTTVINGPLVSQLTVEVS